MANKGVKPKIDGKYGSYAQEQVHMLLLSTRKTTNEVAEHCNKGKWPFFAQENWEMCLLSIRTRAKVNDKHKNNKKWAGKSIKIMTNEVAMHKNKGKWGC